MIILLIKKDDDDDGDDDDDDDDDKRRLYKQLEDIKKELKDTGHLEESFDEEFNRIFRASIGLNGKEYTVMGDKGLESRKYVNNFSKLINDYLQDKIYYKTILQIY